MRSQPTAPPPPPPMPNWLSVRCRSAVCPPNPHRSTPGCQGCENVHCKSRPSTDPCANPFCSALKSQFCGGAGDINTWLNTEVVNTFWSFKLGQGGFGAVYKCLNLCTGREVAVKITPGNTVYAQRESALWQAMSSNHQNLVKLYDVHDVGRYKYFIMEYCPDGDLNNFMTPRQVDLRSVLGYVHGIAKGLLYLHQHQLLHRDIKPENILVKNFGNGNYIMKLSDFGLMRFVSCSDNIFSNVPSQTVALAVTMGVGTPLWWAPEVTSGNTYSLAADIWPFGLVILAMLTHQAGQPLLPDCNLQSLPNLKNHIKQMIRRKYGAVMFLSNTFNQTMEVVCETCKQLLGGMLSVDPKWRSNMQIVYPNIKGILDQVSDLDQQPWMVVPSMWNSAA